MKMYYPVGKRNDKDKVLVGKMIIGKIFFLSVQIIFLCVPAAMEKDSDLVTRRNPVGH